MADQGGKVIRKPSGGGIISASGSEAGKDKKYDQIAEDEERQKYRASHGAGGIGGARVSGTPEFKAKEEAHMKAWRAARKAAAAKKRGQARAAQEVGKPKEE